MSCNLLHDLINRSAITVPITDEMKSLAEAIDLFYDMPDNWAYGPLHCELADGNLDNQFVNTTKEEFYSRANPKVRVARFIRSF